METQTATTPTKSPMQRYVVEACHDYWVIRYIATGSIVDSAKRKCDIMRCFNRQYSTYNA